MGGVGETSDSGKESDEDRNGVNHHCKLSNKECIDMWMLTLVVANERR